MTIYINEEDKKLFEQNGFNQQSVGDTVNHYRSMGMSDDEIQGKINQRLEGWRTPAVPKQKVNTEYTYPNQDLSGIENNPAAQREFKRNVDNIYNIPQVPMPPRNSAGYTNSDGVTVQNPPNVLQNGINAVKQIPQALDTVNNIKNQIQQPVVNAGRAIARPLLPKGIENNFLGSQEDEALLKQFDGVQFPSHDELLAQYKGGKISKDAYIQTLKDKLAVENARLDKNFRDWRNAEIGKEALLLGLSALTGGTATAGGGALATTGTAASQLPRLAQLGNLVKAAAATGAKEGAKFGAKYGVGASLIDKNSNPITEPMKDAIDFGVAGAVLNPLLQGGAGAIIGANRAFGITNKLGEAAQKAAEAIKNAPKEFQSRTNPNNYTKETVYEKNPFNNTFEPKERWQYKPQETPEPRNITPEPKQIAAKNSIAEVAPKTVAKMEQNKPNFELVKPETIEQGATSFSALPQNIVKNNSDVQGPKQYKVVNGRTVKVEPSEEIEKIAPKTTKKIQEEKQAAEISGENIRVGLDENGDLQHYDISDPKNIKKVGEPIYNESTHINKELPKSQDLIEKIAAEGFDKAEVRALFDKMENGDYILNDRLLPKIQAKLYKDKEKGISNTFDELESFYQNFRQKRKEKLATQNNAIENIAPNTAAKIEKQKTISKLPSHKYEVKIGKDGNVSDGLYMEGNKFHTDGNAAYLKEFVNADTTKVSRTTNAPEKTEQTMLEKFDTTAKYTRKLEDIGKGIVTPARRGIPKETWRIFKAGEFEDGQPNYVVVNDKYLLDKKDLELFADNENLRAPISIRKNGQQIGIVMPIANVDTAGMVDIKPIKTTVKSEPQEPKETISKKETVEEPAIEETQVTTEKTSEVEKDINVPSKNDTVQEYKTSEKYKNLPENLKNAVDFALENEPVTTISGKEFQSDGVKLTDKVTDYYAEHYNGEVENPELGPVKLDKEGVKSSLGHGMSNKKAAAYAVVPEVIKNGKVFDKQTNWKNRGYDTAVIIAPVKIGNENYVCEVVVEQRPNRQGFYLHEVEISKKLSDVFKTPTEGSTPDSSNLIISHLINDFKPDTAQVEPITDQVKPKEGTSKSASTEKYEDYGEKIWGAKKDLWVDYNKALKKDIDTDDISKVKLNDVFPEPNYEKLIQEGVNPELLAIVKACRDIIPAKPKGRNVYYYGKRWIEQLNTFRTFAADILDGNITPEQISESLDKIKANSLADVINTYKKVGYPAFLNIKGMRISKELTTWEAGKELSPAEWRYWVLDEKNKFGGAAGVFKTEKEAVEFLQRVSEHAKEPTPKSKDAKLIIYKYRGDKSKDGWVIGKKSGSNYIDLKKGFETSKEATEYLNNNKDSLVETLEKLKEEPIVRTDVNEARIGGDYRNGEDATPEKFANTFGFRGVQFGNYVENTKRIVDINSAYDAFMDMIGIINIPEKAVSLNGTLGMAFGARGNGGKNPPAAHYEPDEVVINLTKMHGRGSLAHEWWHALDNYFGKMNNDVHGYATEHYTKRGEIRQEVLDAFADVRKAVRNAIEGRSLSIDSFRSKDYWSQVREMTARSFEAYIKHKANKLGISNDYLANIINEETYNSEVKPYPYPTKAEMPEIEKAFDNFFKTIKTRETDKGVELYDVDIPEFMKDSKKVDNGFKDIELSPIFDSIKKGISGAELAKMLPKELGDIVMQRASKYKFSEMITKGRELGVNHWKRAVIELNLKAIGNNPKRFVNTLMHEVKHAEQYKLYLDIIGKPKNSWTFEERSFVAKYNICGRVNKIRDKFYKKHRELCDRFEKNNFYSAEERNAAISRLSKKEQDIIDQNDKNLLEYLKADFESEARAEGIKYDKDYRTESRYRNGASGALSSNYGTTGKRSLGTNSRDSFAAVSESGYRGDEINQVVRNKVYEWHGNLESDRYDVDKSLNSFIQLTKHKAAEFSKKLGIKVSDKQLREIMPFLRERTGFPKNLDRDDLRNIFDKLSNSDKAELAKFADSVSDKFEKYYTNYKDAKGEQTSESIENHISHIWDLDDKKKSLLTNYITTNSKFAKQRTIKTLIEGIDGIEINGEKVQFKPKTLDYAEILKSSSDNLIKATHDSILANEIKNLRYQGEPLVLPAAKAPSEWIEVNHPALNKAVYMGEVGEDKLPMLMETPVKVHPEIADYVSAIFEVQKNSKFWNRFDSANGLIKQVLLSGSGFHGYALSESAAGNVGIVRTVKELNPLKIYDQIKNGNYDIYKKEEFAKRAIRAGVQLGTPSDLQRGLIEEALKHLPMGKVLSGAAQLNNKVLWDVLFNNYKLLTFNVAVENAEKAGSKLSTEEERAIAQWVNDSFGGQVWELLGIKKSAIKTASRVLLSPDWNFSTIRQANALLNTEQIDKLINSNKNSKRIGRLLGVSEENSSNGMRGKKGRVYWLRAAIYLTTMFNVMNAVFREKDRKEHPELYPSEMTPMDYSIWSNIYPMDNFYEKIMPNVFIGRNKDGSARYLRLGKQFREMPEFLFDFMGKMGGKTAPLLSMLFRVYFGMGINDAWSKLNGGEAYLDQDIWEGYGENAEKKEGLDLAIGRAKVAGKSMLPFMLSKYTGDKKHEFSWWDLVAQTHAGGAKSTVYKQTIEALRQGKSDKIDEIKIKAYQDGLPYKDIKSMVDYANNNYKAENTKKYKKKLADSFAAGDEKEYEQIRKQMTKKHLSEDEQRRIRDNALKEYLKNNKN